jgi:hypothetical protein
MPPHRLFIQCASPREEIWIDFVHYRVCMAFRQSPEFALTAAASLAARAKTDSVPLELILMFVMLYSINSRMSRLLIWQ